MLLSRPQTTLLAFLAISSFAQASWFDEALDELIRRQEDAAGVRTISDSVVSPIVSTTTSQPSSTTESSSTNVQSSTTEPPQSSTTTPITTSSATPSSTSSSTTSSSSSTTQSSSTSSETVASSSSTTTKPPTTTSPPTTASQTVIRVTRTETVDGQVRTAVSESTSSVPVATDPASLNQSNETNGSSMSPKTRSTIIGVVVGLGGAVLLGGLAVVAYRIWGRKKNNREDRDDFRDFSRPDTGLEKAGGSSGSGSTNPFKSTLENYHNPAKVNASSNF